MAQHTLSTHFTKEQRDWIKRRANLPGISEGEVVRQAVKRAMEADQKPLRSAVESTREGQGEIR